MTKSHSTTVEALLTLLREILVRAPSTGCFVLNPHDPGLIDTMRRVSAEIASSTPGVGRKTIAAHANHVLYGIELANQAFAGNRHAFQSADWSQAWRQTSVSDQQWQRLVATLEQQTRKLIEYVEHQTVWDQLTLTGCFGIAAHTAYHLGAIRQILLDVEA